MMESKQCQVSETLSLGLKQRTQVHHRCPGTSQQETGKGAFNISTKLSTLQHDYLLLLITEVTDGVWKDTGLETCQREVKSTEKSIFALSGIIVSNYSAIHKAASALATGHSQNANGRNVPHPETVLTSNSPFTAYGTFFSRTVELYQSNYGMAGNCEAGCRRHA